MDGVDSVFCETKQSDHPLAVNTHAHTQRIGPTLFTFTLYLTSRTSHFPPPHFTLSTLSRPSSPFRGLDMMYGSSGMARCGDSCSDLLIWESSVQGRDSVPPPPPLAAAAAAAPEAQQLPSGTTPAILVPIQPGATAAPPTAPPLLENDVAAAGCGSGSVPVRRFDNFEVGRICLPLCYRQVGMLIWGGVERTPLDPPYDPP